MRRELLKRYRCNVWHLVLLALFILFNFILFITAWKVSIYGVFSGQYFPAFGMNTETYGISLRIQSERGKIRTRKNSVYGHFTQCMPIDVCDVLSFRSFANSFFDLFPFTPHVMGFPRNYFFILIYCDQAKLRQYPLFCKVHPENQNKVSILATM